MPVPIQLYYSMSFQRENYKAAGVRRLSLQGAYTAIGSFMLCPSSFFSEGKMPGGLKQLPGHYIQLEFIFKKNYLKVDKSP